MPLLRSDPELLAAFREGRRAALETVYRHYARAIDIYLRGLAKHANVAELSRADCVKDLLQETFVHAFSQSARDTYDGIRDFLPYLKTIARHCFVDFLRKRKYELPLHWDETADTLGEPDVADDAYEPEVVATLRAYLRDLDPQLKRVYEQRFEQGLSQEAACVKLGLSRRSLRTQEEHLRRGLRKALLMAGLMRGRGTFPVGALQPSRE